MFFSCPITTWLMEIMSNKPWRTQNSQEHSEERSHVWFAQVWTGGWWRQCGVADAAVLLDGSSWERDMLHVVSAHRLWATVYPQPPPQSHSQQARAKTTEQHITQWLDAGSDLRAASIHSADTLLFPEGVLIVTASIQHRDAQKKLKSRSKALLPCSLCQFNHFHNMPL